MAGRLFLFASVSVVTTIAACSGLDLTSRERANVELPAPSSTAEGTCLDCAKDRDCSAFQDCLLKCEDTPAKNVFVTEVLPAIAATCSKCHVPAGPGPLFFRSSTDGTYATFANGTYRQFKALRFDQPNSIFVTKGAHEGPALTAAQQAKVEKWVDAESLGAGVDVDGGVVDGGTRDGGVEGGVDGGGDGGKTDDGGKADGGATDGGSTDSGADAAPSGCEATCKAQDPSGDAKWTAYNACTAKASAP